MVLLLGIVLGGFELGQRLCDRVIHITLIHSAQAASDDVKDKKSDANRDRYEQLELFQKVLHFVESHYVDEVKTKDLVHGAIRGMLESLDPHSNFLPEDVFREMKVDTSGKFGGLGIEVGVRDKVLTVIAPIEGSPAWKAGVKPNDRIIRIDGASTKGMSLAEAVAKMRGKKGAAVKVSIFRKGFKETKDYMIAREEIKLQSVKKEEIEPGFGYIRLSTFNETAAQDVAAAIKELEKSEKLKGLVFDMRNTPGGLLDQAIEVSSLFYDEGEVVSTIGREKSRKDVRQAQKGKARKDIPLAVLVNSSTASAAEIVAGALQDQKRAVIMGEKTFGKGSVQTVIDLGNDLGLKLTVARFYTPAGHPIQEYGVTPDIQLDEFDPDLLAKAKINSESLQEKDLPGHLAGEGVRDQFSRNELDELVGNPTQTTASDEESGKPIRLSPKDDYQVKEAVNYLKSFRIFQKVSTRE